MEANRKIYINDQGIIGAILLPEEPKEPDYGDCEMDAADLEISGEQLYKVRMDLWTTGMKQYGIELTKAKKEFVPFGDQLNLALYLQPKTQFPSANLELPKDTIHDLPDGYVVETIEYEAHDVRAKLKKI